MAQVALGTNLRHELQLQRPVGGDYGLLVHLHAPRHEGHAPGGQDDVLRSDDPAVLGLHLVRLGGNRALALDDVHALSLQRGLQVHFHLVCKLLGMSRYPSAIVLHIANSDAETFHVVLVLHLANSSRCS